MLKLFKKNWNKREDYSFRFWLANLILGGYLRNFIAVSLQGFVMKLNDNLEEMKNILSEQDYSESDKCRFIDNFINYIKDDEKYLENAVYDIFSV